MQSNTDPISTQHPFRRRFENTAIIGNSRGQGLIEYLIIVALIAVTTIGVMRVVGQNINSKLASVSAALRGERTSYSMDKVEDSMVKKRDLGDFMNGVGDATGK